MNSDLLQATNSVLDQFAKVWTFGLEDLNKPSSDQVLNTLIQAQPEALHSRLNEEFFGPGPLTSLLNEDIQEIVVAGRSEIWFERAGTFQRLDDQWGSELTFKNFIDRLIHEAGVRVDLTTPFADGRWRGFRLHLGCAPLTHCDYHLTLRKVPPQTWTLDRLRDVGWCSPEDADLIRSLIHERKNVLVVGPTGSGKTSVLGACLRELPHNERLVIIEDTDELSLPNAASTKLLSRPFVSAALPEVTLTDLVKQSLRMRPFRLVVGEVRGSEAKDLLLALATGHSGSWGTLHASEARQALLRLEMLVQMGAPQWSLQAIRQLLQLSLDALIVCGNRDGHRCLDGIYEVASLESIGLLLEPLRPHVDIGAARRVP